MSSARFELFFICKVTQIYKNLNPPPHPEHHGYKNFESTPLS